MPPGLWLGKLSTVVQIPAWPRVWISCPIPGCRGRLVWSRGLLCLFSSRVRPRLCLVASLVEFIPHPNILVTLYCPKIGMPSDQGATISTPTKWKGNIVKTKQNPSTFTENFLCTRPCPKHLTYTTSFCANNRFRRWNSRHTSEVLQVPFQTTEARWILQKVKQIFWFPSIYRSYVYTMW